MNRRLSILASLLILVFVNLLQAKTLFYDGFDDGDNWKDNWKYYDQGTPGPGPKQVNGCLEFHGGLTFCSVACLTEPFDFTKAPNGLTFEHTVPQNGTFGGAGEFNFYFLSEVVNVDPWASVSDWVCFCERNSGLQLIRKAKGTINATRHTVMPLDAKPHEISIHLTSDKIDIYIDEEEKLPPTKHELSMTKGFIFFESWSLPAGAVTKLDDVIVYEGGYNPNPSKKLSSVEQSGKLATTWTSIKNQ